MGDSLADWLGGAAPQPAAVASAGSASLNDWLGGASPAPTASPAGPTTPPPVAMAAPAGGLSDWLGVPASVPPPTPEDGDVALSPSPPGVPPPELEKSGISKFLDVVDAPGNAIRGGIDALVNERNLGRQIKQGWRHDKTFALGRTLKQAGILDENPIVRSVIGFAGDALADPLNLVGVGELTGAGKVAKTVSGAARFEKLAGELGPLAKFANQIAPGIEAGSKLAGKVAGIAEEARFLAPTWTQQAALGQRTLINVAGIPVIKGTTIFDGTGRIASAIGNFDKAKSVASWSNRIFGTTFLMPEAAKDALEMSRMTKNEYLAQAFKIKANAEADRAVLDRVAAQLDVPVQYQNALLSQTWELKQLDDALAQKIITKDEHRIVSGYIERNTKLLEEAQKAGIDVTKLSNEEMEYMAHLLTRDAMDHLAKLPGSTMTEKVSHFIGGLREAEPGFARQRLIDMSAVDANLMAWRTGKLPEGIKLFHDDPVYVQAARELAQLKATGNRDLISRIGKVFGMEASAAPSEFVQVAEGQLKGMALPKDVHEMMTAWQDAQLPEKMPAFLRDVFDPITRWWAGWSLAVRPAFHIRNVVGNIWNNYLGGVRNPQSYYRALMIRISRNRPEVLEAMEYLAANGRKYTGTELKGLMDKLAVTKSGQYAAGWQGLEETLLRGTDRAAAELPTWRKALAQVPLAPGATAESNLLMKYGTLTGEFFEENARAAHFIEKVMGGEAPEQAALSVKKHLFNYNELTTTERSFFKRVAPFWAWSKNNIPLQVEMALKHPGRFARIAQAKNETEANYSNNLPEQLLPKWMQDGLAVRLGRSPNNPQLQSLITLGSYLPAQDIQKVFGFKELGAALASMVNPLLKLPIELPAIGNLDIFRTSNRGEIVHVDKGHDVDVLGARVSPSAAYFLRAMAFVNDIDRWNPGHIFGEGPKLPGQQGKPAKINLLAPWRALGLDFGPETATTRQRQDVEDQVMAGLQFGTGLKPSDVDMHLELSSRKGEYMRERARISQEIRAVQRRGDKPSEAQLRVEQKRLDNDRRTYLELARHYGVLK